MAMKMDNLLQLIVNNDELVSYVYSSVDALLRTGEGEGSDEYVQTVIDGAIDSAFQEMSIWEMVANAKADLQKTNFVQGVAVDTQYGGDDGAPRPQFSPSEPTRMAVNPGRRHKVPERSSKGVKSPSSVGAASPSPNTSPAQQQRGKSSPSSSPMVALAAENDSSGSAGKPKPTVSPDLVEASPSPDRGTVYRAPLIIKRSPKSASPKKTHGKAIAVSAAAESPSSALNRSSRSSRSAGSPASAYASDSSIQISPASYNSPAKSSRQQEHEGRSPGSNLEDDDFDNYNMGSPDDMGAHDGENFVEHSDSSGGGGLDFTKRYKFSGDFPEDNEDDGNNVAAPAPAEEADEGLDLNAWLLAQSEGNPLESSIGSVNRSNHSHSISNHSSPVRSHHSSPLRSNHSSARTSPVRSPAHISRRSSPAASISARSSPGRTGHASRSSPAKMTMTAASFPVSSGIANKSPVRNRYADMLDESNQSHSHDDIVQSQSPTAALRALAEGSPQPSPTRMSPGRTRMSPSPVAMSPAKSFTKAASPSSHHNSPISSHMASPLGRNSPGSSRGSSPSIQSLYSSVASSLGSPSPFKTMNDSGTYSQLKSPSQEKRSPKVASPKAASPKTASPSPGMVFKGSVSGRNETNPLMRTIVTSGGSLDQSFEEDGGSLGAGPAVYETNGSIEIAYTETEDDAAVDGKDEYADGFVDYGSDDGNIERFSDAGNVSPDSFARKYAQSPQGGSSNSPGGLNSSIESGDNVAYGSDFEQDQDYEDDEDFGDDFEELDEGDEDANKRRVRFKPKPVSDVFVTRDKYTAEEVRTLFYTQEEALQFSVDYSKETHRAEIVGQTWYDWWDGRTEAEWEADDIENEKLSAAWSDEDGNSMDEYLEELSGGDDSNEFSNF